MSLLSICQGAALRCNFGQQPSQAFSSGDTSVLQLVAFAQDTGRELIERANWTGIKAQALITGDGVSTLFDLPADWLRLCPSDKSPMGALISLARPTIPLVGPVNDEWLNQMKALPAYPAFPVWRIVNNQMEIWPALADGEVVQFWYYSKNWIKQFATETLIPEWSNDGDTSLIEESVIMKGTIWRWKRAKGLDYAEEFREYQMSAERNASQQDDERVISTSTHSVNADTFFPGTISYTAP